MTELAHSYAAIIKQEKLADGTLRVYGKATDDSLDVDQQICDANWLKQAMPDWFTSGGNIREQHSNIAAGVATEYEEKADGHYITALVVDPTSVKKVETKVLKGFSIGIRGPRVVRDTKAAGGRIVDGQIVEVSLVDRPANPNAKLMLAKATDTGELMSVKQIDIPLPNEVFKNENVEAPAELVVEEAPAIVEEAVELEVTEAPAAETLDEKTTQISELVNNAKALQATLAKFDQGLYDNAVAALADLIVVEANEMKEGSNEIESLCLLLDSVKHLFAWYAGEAEEGEVASVNPAIAEEASELEMGYSMEMAADKADEPEAPVVTEDSTETTEPTEEAEDLAAALEAEREKSAKLEAELDAAKALSVGGGPKRAILNKTSSLDVDFTLQKATQLRAKARSTEDRVLAKGYSAWADELEAQARKQD
jgi:hypothetical protein